MAQAMAMMPKNATTRRSQFVRISLNGKRSQMVSTIQTVTVQHMIQDTWKLPETVLANFSQYGGAMDVKYCHG